MSIKAELTQLLAELERLDKEYEFCKSRALHHYDGARAGNMTALLMYHGARERMQEIERRALTIDARITDLESIYSVGGAKR